MVILILQLDFFCTAIILQEWFAGTSMYFWLLQELEMS